MKGIFSVLVENKDGVLSQISGLFARRGFNIDSLAVGETERHDISSMTIVSTGDQRTVDQIEKHLNKKLDVIKVRRLEETRSVLKSNGFRWSPRYGAWQRQLTRNAEYAARCVLKAISKAAGGDSPC